MAVSSSNYVIDEVTKILKDDSNSLADELVSLDENEPEWEVIGGEEEEANVLDDEGWVHLKQKNLKVQQEY
ncbi:hypothetical protein PR202_ga02041 [Eleusine coracana subsp. coracana]|uniref:Uncharacterized protein n=1 Tax=Eleusine coracana subsp. coracana TaxID=191504 RepID=A0AAV5BJT5_ELECO|nr:hypothetical protein PR202_ga01354 [Eleusine coracana subsp. coracana]GJM86207.1 hypothetical protein PR202_ga02041 [Eleusine coracana subsp. coracana]